MVKHTDLGHTPFARFRALQALIMSNEVTLGGYSKKKIYGTLSCNAGKRMKPENRVFFCDEQQALHAGYRPCGRCLPEKYKIWKATNGTI